MDRRDYLARGATVGIALLAGCFGGRGFTVEDTARVGWESFDFDPRYVHVDRGTEVTWTNDESYNHTVTAASDNWQKDTNVPAGETTTHTFEQEGVYTAVCDEHDAHMKIGVGDARIDEPVES